MKCIHCAEAISDDTWPVHRTGSQSRLHSCGRESDLPYGYEAHAVGTPCVYPCLGASRPDPRIAAAAPRSSN